MNFQALVAAALAATLGPLAAFMLLFGALYAWSGFGSAVELMVKLWAACAVAFVVLIVLTRCRENASRIYFALTAAMGVALGGGASAAIAFAPDWSALLDPSVAGPEWAVGAAFSSFFVGLSVAAAGARRRERHAQETRRQMLEARLQTLTAQIEPHFLMNTLANLRHLIRADPDRACEMLDHLADFLGGSLERSRRPRGTLGQELQFAASYLAIMQIRLGDRLRFRIDVAEDLQQLPFPPLLLQTLAENAVKHGIEPSGRAGEVTISARRERGSVWIKVVDTGVGIGRVNASHAGIGLRNTLERLDTFYRGRASLSVRPARPAGTVAAVRIAEPER